MTDEVFNFLSKQQSGIVWHCASCQASTVRLEDSIRQLEKRVKVNEDRLDQVELREKQTSSRLDKIENMAEGARKAASEGQKDTLKVVFEELRERDEKKFNVILHSIGESVNETVEEEKDWDAKSFDNVMRELHLNLKFKDCATYSRRLGARRPGQARPRPLLVVLKTEQDRAAILANTHKLSRSHLREVSVVPDLTMQQREADDDLRKEASRRNREELSDEDRSKNLRWVAVGRKGVRKLVKKEWREFPSRPNSNTATNRPRPDQINRKRTAEAEAEKDAPGKKQRSRPARGGEEEEVDEEGEDEEVLQEEEGDLTA